MTKRKSRITAFLIILAVVVTIIGIVYYNCIKTFEHDKYIYDIQPRARMVYSCANEAYTIMWDKEEPITYDKLIAYTKDLIGSSMEYQDIDIEYDDLGITYTGWTDGEYWATYSALSEISRCGNGDKIGENEYIDYHKSSDSEQPTTVSISRREALKEVDAKAKKVYLAAVEALDFMVSGDKEITFDSLEHYTLEKLGSQYTSDNIEINMNNNFEVIEGKYTDGEYWAAYTPKNLYRHGKGKIYGQNNID